LLPRLLLRDLVAAAATQQQEEEEEEDESGVLDLVTQQLGPPFLVRHSSTLFKRMHTSAMFEALVGKGLQGLHEGVRGDAGGGGAADAAKPPPGGPEQAGAEQAKPRLVRLDEERAAEGAAPCFCQPWRSGPRCQRGHAVLTPGPPSSARLAQDATSNSAR